MSVKNKVRESIALSWRISNKKVYVVAYCEANKTLLYPIIDYCIFISDKEELHPTTVKNEIFHLKAAFEFLIERRFEVEDFTDDLIKAYRDEELLKVGRNKISSTSENAHKRTVNAKLRRLYLFLHWFNDAATDRRTLIGPRGCQVTSTLDDIKRSGYGNQRAYSERNKFPKLFRNVGEHSRHRTKYIATESDVINLREHFFNNFTEYVALRNVLIMNIAVEIGQRRGSINSLKCSQFSDDVLRNEVDDGISVQPGRQKFGYGKSFDFSLELTYKIRAFIADQRTALLSEMGWDDERTKGCVFISAKDGKPLTDQSLSAAFGGAFKAIGAPRGANLHSFRRLFANTKIEEETAARLALGLDTSVASIAASVSISLGQSNPASIAPYVNRYHGKLSAKSTVVPSKK